MNTLCVLLTLGLLMATSDQEKLFEGTDILGKPADINLVGGQDISAGVQGVPATATPGGQPGGSFGPGREFGVSGSVSGVGPGAPNVSGQIKSLIDRIMKGESVEGFDLSGAQPYQIPEGVTTGASGGSAGALDPESTRPFDVRAGLAGQEGLTLPTANLSAIFGPGWENAYFSMGGGNLLAPPGTAPTAPGAISPSGAGSLASMAAGPLLSLLGKLATQGGSPELQAAIQGLTQAVAPVAAPLAASAATSLAAGAAPTLGSLGTSLAASAPGLIAAAPMAAMQIATGIYSMLEQQALAGKLTERFKGLQQNLPGHIQKIQQAPALLQQLEGVTDPAQAAAIYQQLDQIHQDFQNSGIEDFLKTGLTRVTGAAGQGDLSATFDQGKQIYESLSPFLQAVDAGRIRAQDIAARGGQPIAGGRSIYDYGFSGGGPGFAEAIRPGSTEMQGQLAKFLRDVGVANNYAEGGSLDPGLGGDPYAEQAGPALRAFAGIDPSNQTPVSLYDMQKSFMPGGANWTRVEPGSGGSQYIQTNYGLVDRNLYNQLGAIQPGQYEQGLAALWQPYGGGISRYGFGTGAQPVANRMAAPINAMVASGAGAPDPGTGLAEGLLPEEVRRRLGL